MDKQKEVERIARIVPQKIVAYDRNPAGQHLYIEQRQQIAETLINAGFGDTKAAIKEFAEELKPILDQLGLKIAVALDCCEDKDILLMVKKVEEAHELRLKLSELVKERQ